MFRFLPIVTLLLAFHGPSHAAETRVLDDFRDLSRWNVAHTDDVSAQLSATKTAAGGALHLAFDFSDPHGNPINGYATAHRDLRLDFPENFEIRFRVRGAAPVNNLQFKLVDASGDNVWWMNRPDFTFTPEWQEIRLRRRHIEFAWGPTKDRTLAHSAAVEFVVSSGRDGGKGWVEFDRLELHAFPPETPLPPPRVSANASLPDAAPQAALDGDLRSAWRARADRSPHLDIDFGRAREFSALIAHWRSGEQGIATYQSSSDGKHWAAFAGFTVRTADGDAMFLGEYATRYLRVVPREGSGGTYGLTELEIGDLDFAPTRNAFFAQLAKRAPRGAYPRGFIEQPYWTIVGVDGGAAPALISEDGAVEPRKGGYSIEPFLNVDGRALSWADVESTQQLRDGYLPMPQVTWRTSNVELGIETFARGTREAAQLVARYRLRNRSDRPITGTLQLALRPFQVNPPAQFLNSPGGFSGIEGLAWDGRQVKVDGQASILPLRSPDEFRVGEVGPGPVDSSPNGPRDITYSAFGTAAGALVYKFTLQPHAEWHADLVAATAGALPALSIPSDQAEDWFERERADVAERWRERLDRVRLALPNSARYLADAVRTAHAQILMSRDGAALRPGTRSYARSWIRDGAMIADALLRLGDIDPVREYADWYAPRQFSDGKVPCCVDHRGADPVPENDSEGELVHLVAQLYRYSGDGAGLARHWPHLARAVAYMDRLRATQTGADDAAFRALMPASISHEGYSAKPMHAYWDDFWALTGYADAAGMATALGRGDAAHYAQAHAAFRADLLASIALAVKTHAIDFIPGCAELGDFDATSTTVALSPANEQAHLPPDLLHGTFERYWREFAARADGSTAWEDYTPYEWRNVGAFVRLGWRARAQAALRFFFDSGARPRGWNQWAEVVGRDVRKTRFVGDMPHAWVASDFIRSALDLLAYERGGDRALVLGAGVAPEWLDDEGAGIAGLRTPYGTLSYRMRRVRGRLELHIDAGATPPGGFVFPWPLPGSPGETRIDGKRATWRDDGLHIRSAPAAVEIELPTKETP